MPPQNSSLPESDRPEATGSVTMLYQQLSAGDAAAASQLWRRYFPRIAGVARGAISGRAQRVADADDAAQSAFIAFWQQAQRGDFDADLDREGLWSLLATITVRKARRAARREQAQKRGGGKVLGEAELPAGVEGPMRLDQLLSQISTQEFDLITEELLLALNPELREIAVLRLLGHSNKEIAEQLGCTQRKIQRKLELLRLRWNSVP
jgi:RNA polymerase sigma factor (sigma-70 family)